MITTAFINSFVDNAVRPQGLKPTSFVVLSGTAEAVPFPKPIREDEAIEEHGAIGNDEAIEEHGAIGNDGAVEDRLIEGRRS